MYAAGALKIVISSGTIPYIHSLPDVEALARPFCIHASRGRETAAPDAPRTIATAIAAKATATAATTIAARYTATISGNIAAIAIVVVRCYLPNGQPLTLPAGLQIAPTRAHACSEPMASQWPALANGRGTAHRRSGYCATSTPEATQQASHVSGKQDVWANFARSGYRVPASWGMACGVR